MLPQVSLPITEKKTLLCGQYDFVTRSEHEKKKKKHFPEYIVSSQINQHPFLLLLVGRWTTTS